ncbi:MAG: hypothetical protein QXX55_01420 [Candidatus Pacearchaeota archaeon]
MENKQKMDTKKLLVSLVLFLGVLFFTNIASAQEVADRTTLLVEVDGVNAASYPAIVVGNSVFIRVEFTSLVNASDIKVLAEIEGKKRDFKAETLPFDVESGKRYTKLLKIDVPFELKDVLSDTTNLNIKISGSGYRTDVSYALRVQREPYSARIMSVIVPQKVNAGEIFPVDIVLKNIGYNNLNDVFVSVRIPALNIERTAFFGDIAALECDKDLTPIENYGVNITRVCDESSTDTVSGRIFVQLPYKIKEGVYLIEVRVQNEDITESQTVQLSISNAFSGGNFIVSGNQLLIVNPTNQLVVYRLVPQTSGAVSVTLSDTLVSLPAGTSKMVTVSATSDVTGTYTYSVNVFDVDGSLIDTISFISTIEGKNNTPSPIVVLTVVLAVIFIVLLVVLIVLIGKKPEKSEELGESYY